MLQVTSRVDQGDMGQHEVSTTDMLQDAGWQKEIGQLEADEWLRLIQGEFSGKAQLQRIKCFPDWYNLIVWSVFAMDNWVFL